MLFGGLFSAYVLLRVGAAPGEWPHGWLNPVLGTINTLILALSAITTLLAWVACKVGQFRKFRLFHACTLALALSFLCIKMYEYHDKLIHYEIRLTDGRIADGHMIENNPKEDFVVIEGHYVADVKELYDLREHKHAAHEELKIRAHRSARWKITARATTRSLQFISRSPPARAAHPRRQHRHRLPLVERQKNVEDGTGTLHQPHRSLRPVLAFRGLGLDIFVPGSIFDVMNL